jgi:HptB-dependent secretion and biofilm anti anti-sigma factor
MSVSKKETGDKSKLTISITGTFDFNCVQDFRASYSGDEQYKSYTIDMSNVDHIDSSALGMLLNMKKSVGEGVVISISHCKPNIKKIFMISRFDKKFDFS